MATPAHPLIAALLLGIMPQAGAVDLGAYPTGLLGPLANARAALMKGPLACTFNGIFHLGGDTVHYAGHARLRHDGIQDGGGFGHFLSAPGDESFLQYSVPYSVDNGDGTHTDGGFTCLHLLDTASSKYAVNKFGVGITELHWQANPANPPACYAFVDQVGWVRDGAGHVMTTRINDSPTTTPSAQGSECYKGM